VTEQKFFVFRFGDIEVREREFLLLRAGRVVPVEPKAFRVLLFLLRNPGRVVTKDEIVNAVWNDTSVSDNSLTRSIATLRRLLEDDSREPRYIATVQTIGYRFLCPVDVVDHAPSSTGPLGPDEIPGEIPDETLDETLGKSGLMTRRRLTPVLVAVVSIAILVCLGAWIVHRRIQLSAGTYGQIAEKQSSRMRIVPLTGLPGAVWGPVFSPDGRQIAYTWDGENPVRGDLYVQLVDGKTPLRLTHSRSGFLCCAEWSPDGQQIAFGRCGDNGEEIFVISSLGGPERKLTNGDCPYSFAERPTWTQDGKFLLLKDQCSPDASSGIVVFSLETGTKRCLHSPPSGDLGDGIHILSPDQKTVAFIWAKSYGSNDIYTVPLSGGSARRLTYDSQNVTELMWTPDGERIIFKSNRRGLDRIWRVPGNGGAIEPETVFPGVGTLTHDGSRLAYVEPPAFLSWTSTIWRADLAQEGGKVISLKTVLDSAGRNDSPQHSPDQLHIVFSSYRSGSDEIWRSNADGSEPLQLTSLGGHAGTPRWSPDGKWIAFDYRPGAHSQIYLIDSEGRNTHPITSGDYENLVPSWSRDGAFIYFASSQGGGYDVWRMNLATGNTTRVTHHGGFAAVESYDGKTVYFTKFIGSGMWSVPAAGGEERRIVDAPRVGYWGHFAPTDNGIYLLDVDAPRGPAIMYYNFRNKSLRPVLRLDQSPVPWQANLSASRDGLVLFFAQGEHKSSITMVENFQ
jgi:Tol biopolymer transport system component/DNA-binding winged helix-turn-helix (wHTH) protein